MQRKTLTAQRNRKNFYRGRRLALLSLAATAALPALAAAQTSQWTGTVSNGWANSNNWNPAVVPGQGYTVNVTNTLGLAQTIIYNYTGSAVVLSTLDLNVTGQSGATTETLDQSVNDLSAIQEFIGGYPGSPENGSGTFNQSGGVNAVTTGQLIIGCNSGDQGAYLLSGGAVTSDSSEFVGYAGAATFSQSAGSNTITGTSPLFVGYGPVAQGTYALSSTGSITANSMQIGVFGTGTFTQTGGTITFDQTDPQVYVGLYTGSSGTYTLSGGILSGGAVGPSEYVGAGSFGASNGVFNQSGGTNNAGTLFVGYELGATGVYLLSGGSLATATIEYVGNEATAVFNQSGGTNSASEIQIAAYSGAIGSYNVSGGTATIGSIYVGGNDGGDPAGTNGSPGGTGVLTIGASGVLNVVTALEILDSPGSVLNLSGGTLSVDTLDDNGIPSLFNWTSGTLAVTHGVTFQPLVGGAITGEAFGSSLTLGNNQTLQIEGGETLGGTGGFTLTLNTGSVDNASGSVTVTGVTGTALNLAGGNLTATSLIINSGALVRANQASTLNVGGSVEVSGDLSLDGETSLYATDVDVLSGGTLAVNNASGAAAVITVESGGQLQLDNSASSILNANLNNSGQVIGGGQINGILTNTTTGQVLVNLGQNLTVTGSGSINKGVLNLAGGVLQFTQDLTNNATGSIEGFGSLLTQAGLTNNGTLALAGSSSVSGPVTNGTKGLIHLSGSSPNVFLGAVANSGNLTVDAGASGTFYGPYTGPGSIVDNGALYLNANSVAGAISGSGSLTIGAGFSGPAFVQLAPGSGGGTLGSLAVVSGATLDLTNNSFLVNYGSGADPISSIQTYLINGYNSGAWNGTGINSSAVAGLNAGQSALIYSVGYADGADGIVAGLSSGEIEILPTLAGDAKLQGDVVFGDFQLLSQYFGQSGTTWDEGDFTYNGTTNFGDFQLLSQNFGQSAGGLTSGEIASINGFAAQFGEAFVSSGSGYSLVSVPEPASVGLLVAAGLGLMSRRRRRSR
jgi:hypothetical protein